ncbi:MAG: hypothetical protein M1274_03815, partial [Actinobacteria bacterium]|nr:hypothetical protein [Actinomycetota bacterium]
LYSRLDVHVRQKRAIVEKAAELIAPKATLFIDGGASRLELARQIAKRCKGLTFITNSAWQILSPIVTEATNHKRRQRC